MDFSDVFTPVLDTMPVSSPPNSSLDNVSQPSPPPWKSPPPPPHSQVVSVFIVLVVTLIILGTLVGNVLVVMAVFTSRALRAPQNLFLVSLATADILVATLVIPFSLANEVMGYWYFGSTWCSCYLALDVLFCTSSIVHLCAISLDRYWSVTQAVSYNRRRTPRRIKAMISAVWFISVVISSPPLLMAQKEEKKEEEEEEVQECLLNNQTWYILSSCLLSFFLPGVIMILVYCKIYRVAKQRAASVFVAKKVMEQQASQSETCWVAGGGACSGGGACRGGGAGQYELPGPQPVPLDSSRRGELEHIHLEGRSLEGRGLEGRSLQVDVTSSSSSFSLQLPRRAGGGLKTEEGKEAEGRRSRLKPPPPASSSISWASSDQCSHHGLLPSPVASLSRLKVCQLRERRFTSVLAVVMGVFVLCWFPFFFTYSLHAVCRDTCPVPQALFSLFFWIGYCNSCLNPLIYTVFNRDFRRAFQKILLHTHRPT